MEFQRYLKYCFDKRVYCLLSSLLVFAFNVNAGDIDAVDSETSDEILLQDITYTYQLFTDDSQRLDCCGTLNFSIVSPVNTRHVIFERTVKHITETDLSKLRFLVRSYYFPDTEAITKPDMYWGTYFRVRASLTDGTNVYSSIYSINDFIGQEDLDSLRNASSVKDIDVDDVTLRVYNKDLYINTSGVLSISVSDLYGNRIFNDNITQPTVISLDKATSPFIIVNYKTSNVSKTKKLLIP